MMSFRNTSHKTLADKIRGRIESGKLIVSLLSAAFFTVYTLVMLYKNWGRSIYLYIILSFVFLYILLSAIFISIIKLKGGKVRSSVQNYRSGLAILKSFLALINFGLTISIFSLTLLSDADAFFQAAVLIVSLIWAVFQIVYQIIMVIKRLRASRRKKRAALAKAKKKQLSLEARLEKKRERLERKKRF